MNSRTPSLAFCIVMDLIGYASYAIPVVGELTDVVWAPISGLIFFLAFRGWKGAIGGIFDMVEELLPGTDFIPTFTIMWFIRKWQNKSQIPNSKSQINLKFQTQNQNKQISRQNAERLVLVTACWIVTLFII